MYHSNYRRPDNNNFLKPGELRINFQIKVPQVRLSNGDEQLGIVNTEYARKIADEAGLDLVEVVANTSPPICKIMDYGKFKYEKKLKEKEAAKKQREATVQYKEIRLRPAIACGDIETKLSQARKFLEDGYKVQFVIKFKGREMNHREGGIILMQKLIDGLVKESQVETAPKFDGSKMICTIYAKS
jgi:translation initiation factor IF-3